MAESEKLKKLDVEETSIVSGGTIYSAPSSIHGKDTKGNSIKVYYVADKSSPSGVLTFYSKESAKDWARSQGLSTRIVAAKNQEDAYKFACRLKK